MNIDFNILWFEDNEEWYLAEKEEIEEYISGFGFVPRITRLKSIPNDNLIKEIENKYYDLIFADLNLEKMENGEEAKGNDAIQLLRSRNILADALFYSTDGKERISSVMQNETLEGVYLSIRDDIFFPQKAKGLIDKMIRRSEDIINIRGMLMDNVSEFDEMLKDVIKKFLSLSTDEDKNFLDTYAYNKVCKSLSNSIEKAKKINDSFILNALNEPFVIDSFKLSMLVNKIFNKFYPDFKEMDGFHEKYSSKILKERNQLAHAKKEAGNDGAFYFMDKEGNRIEYNSRKCMEIRTNVKLYRELLTKIIDVVK